MANLPVTVACGPYDRMEAIRTGAVQIEGIDVTYVAIQSPPEIFARMIKNQAFDVAEMSMAHYLISRSRGTFPFIALPVFPSRLFRHGFIFVNQRTGISAPEDLAGRRIGVQEYRQTATVWIRGLLRDECGVDLSGVRWFEGGVDVPRRPDQDMDLRPVTDLSIETIGPGETLNDKLAAGEIDALIGARRPAALGRHPDVTRLFPDYRATERDYFARTGIFPIMHTLVMREDLYRAQPWVAESLVKGFEAAKAWALEQMRFSGAMRYTLPWLYDDLDEVDALFGGDCWPYGIAANRTTLDAFVGYLIDDGFIAAGVALDEMFTPIVGWEE